MLNSDQLKTFEENPLALNPVCMVCTKEIPPPRSRDSRHKTCSPECHEVLKKYQKRVDADRFCLSCLRPCTPDQRADFKRWRVHRGDRGKPIGRPFRQYEKELTEAMTKVIPLLREFDYELLLNYGTFEENSETRTVTDEKYRETLANVRNVADEIKKLLDNPS